jgi:hypothetical protein
MISSQTIFALSVGCLAEKQHIPMFLVRSDWGSNPRATALEVSTLSITPLMRFTRKVQWPTSCSTKLQYSHRGYNYNEVGIQFFFLNRIVPLTAKWTSSSSSSHQNVTYFRHDSGEKLSIWRHTIITHSFHAIGDCFIIIDRFQGLNEGSIYVLVHKYSSFVVYGKKHHYEMQV